jgi:hypothetical protein
VSHEQIIHQPQALLNRCEFPITVSVDLVGSIPSDSAATFVSAPPSTTAWDK